MKKACFLAITCGLTSFLMAGCSTPTTQIRYTKSETHVNYKNNIISYNLDKDTAWRTLLSKFSNSPFQIDTINNEARHLKVVLKGRPDFYIDCGKRTIITEKQANTTITNAKSQYSFSAYRHIHLDRYHVQNSFTGKAGILVSGDDTSSRAVVQAVMDLETTEERSTTQGPTHKRVRKGQLTLKNNEEPFSDVLGTTCRSTGKFEESLINLISI